MLPTTDPDVWRRREARLDNLRIAAKLLRDEIKRREREHIRPLRRKLRAIREEEWPLAAWVLSNNPSYRSVLQRAKRYAKTLTSGG